MNIEQNLAGWLAHSPSDQASVTFIRDRETMELIACRGWTITALSPANSLFQAAPNACHVGMRASRLEDDGPSALRERAFSSAWQKEQEGDLLAHLLGTGDAKGVVTKRDAEVAATIIQWLGTNVGQAFLNRAEAEIEKAR